MHRRVLLLRYFIMIKSINIGFFPASDPLEQTLERVKAAGFGAVELNMNEENAFDLLACPDIDGGLIGGASLVPEKFVRIIQAANQPKRQEPEKPDDALEQDAYEEEASNETVS